MYHLILPNRNMHYGNTGCGAFKGGGDKKLLKFEFWINGELSKIGHYFNNKVTLILQKKMSMKKNMLLNLCSSMKNIN